MRNIFIFAVFSAILFAGCMTEPLYLAPMRGVNFEDNCIETVVTRKASQDIEDKIPANQAAYRLALEAANEDLVSIIGRVAEVSEKSFDPEAARGFVNSRSAYNAALVDPNPEKGVWTIKRRVRLNGSLTIKGVNDLLGIPVIYPREKGQAKGEFERSAN